MKPLNCLFLVVGMGCAAWAADPVLPVTQIRQALAAGVGRRAALDGEAGRLYLSGPGQVLVLDLEGRVRGVVTGVSSAQDLGLAPELGIGFTCNARSSTVSVFNLATLEVEKQLRTTGAEPGTLVFEPATRRIFSFNRQGCNATAFDAYGGAVAGSIALGGRPGPAVTDGGGTVFVAVGERPEIQVLDARKLVRVQRWPVPELGPVRALALDPERQCLFLLGDAGRLNILDAGSGRLLASLGLDPSATGLVCDAGTGRVYVLAEAGSLQELEPGPERQWLVGARISTRPGGRAMALDDRRHLLYLPVAAVGLPAFPEGPGFQVQVVAAQSLEPKFEPTLKDAVARAECWWLGEKGDGQANLTCKPEKRGGLDSPLCR